MIYFLTVNYYSKALITDLLASIASSITSPYEVLIVNNSPHEKEIHQLKSGRVNILESGENIGFGAACNLGIEQIFHMNSNALVWLINPDATLDKDADQYIQSCFDSHPSIAILGTQIRDHTGALWFPSGKFNPWTGYINHAKIPGECIDEQSEICPSDWVSGCSMIINLAQFSKCPAFDPSYFLYCEDADFCIRYARQGYRVAVTRKTLVMHKVSAIIGKNKKFLFHHYTFSRLLFLNRHATSSGLLMYTSYLLIKIVNLFFKDPKNAQGRWQGLRDFLLNQRPSKP